MRPNDCIPSEKRSGVVYQIPCASSLATYVGQTGRQLGQRMKEHCRAVDSGDCISSAVADAWGSHHPVDWDCVRVLDHHSHLHQRLVLESIHIRSQPNSLNRYNGAMPQVYDQRFRNQMTSLPPRLVTPLTRHNSPPPPIIHNPYT